MKGSTPELPAADKPQRDTDAHLLNRNEEKAKHDELAASAMNATEGSSSESTALKAKEDKVGWFGKLKAAVGTLWSLRRRIG